MKYLVIDFDGVHKFDTLNKAKKYMAECEYDADSLTLIRGEEIYFSFKTVVVIAGEEL